MTNQSLEPTRGSASTLEISDEQARLLENCRPLPNPGVGPRDRGIHNHWRGPIRVSNRWQIHLHESQRGYSDSRCGNRQNLHRRYVPGSNRRRASRAHIAVRHERSGQLGAFRETREGNGSAPISAYGSYAWAFRDEHGHRVRLPRIAPVLRAVCCDKWCRVGGDFRGGKWIRRKAIDGARTLDQACTDGASMSSSKSLHQTAFGAH